MSKIKTGEHWKMFALFLKDEMVDQGINQSQLARSAGVHRSTIKRFFDLDHCPSFDIVIRIIHALKLEENFFNIK